MRAAPDNDRSLERKIKLKGAIKSTEVNVTPKNGVRICLVSPGHLGSNPRLIKEADALVEAGFHVHVISGDSYPGARVRDASILKRAKWRSEIIPLCPNRITYLSRRLVQGSGRFLFSLGGRRGWIAARAQHALFPALKSAAIRAKADFYIGHCLAALPVVVVAGKKNRARIGFDAEDFHSGEAEDTGSGRLDNAIARTLEASLLSHCHYLTAASPCIAKAYQDCYGVKPVPIRNVFPLSEAVEAQPAPETPSFYWFSQTVGPGRGLEDFIEILRRLQRPVRLDLRGHVTEIYASQLKERTQETLVELQLLSPDVPQFMVRGAAGHTAGLGLELRVPLNRDLCLTNKAFTYLLAGIPVVLSRTRAQEQLAVELGDACLLIDLEDADRSSRQLADWLGNSATQANARREAFRLGRDRYNWDHEKEIYLTQIKRILASAHA